MGAGREVERDDARGRAADSDAATSAQRDGDAATVLVIDDEPAIRTLVRMLLDRSAGFELAGEAIEGDQGIELAAELQPDIVLLDLLMEGMDGREALPHILRRSPRSMVVVLSALSGVDEAEPSFAGGAFAYVEKSALGRLTDELTELHALFKRALAGDTVWAPGGPTRVRR